MFGAGTGNLTVTLEQGNKGKTEIVRLEGEKGPNWLEVNQTFTLTGLFATVSVYAAAKAQIIVSRCGLHIRRCRSMHTSEIVTCRILQLTTSQSPLDIVAAMSLIMTDPLTVREVESC